MEKQLYSMQDISDITGIKVNTLKYRRKLFDKYLPGTGEGNKKKFYQESIVLMQQIDEGYKAGLSSEDIEKNLFGTASIEIKQPTPTTNNEALIQALGMMFEKINNIEEQLSTIRQSNDNIQTNTNTLVEETKTVRHEINALGERKEWATIEKIERNLYNPWWRKFWK